MHFNSSLGARRRNGLPLALLLGGFLAPIQAIGQTGDQSFGYFMGGSSQRILGAREERNGAVVGLDDVRDDPKWKWNWKSASVRPVENVYLMYHYGHDQDYGFRQTLAVGVTYGIRLIMAPESRLFLQYDFGPQFDTSRSRGLPSVFNVTPWLTLGSEIPGKTPVEFGVSIMHISNIYTERPNWGQDFIYAFVGVKL